MRLGPLGQKTTVGYDRKWWSAGMTNHTRVAASWIVETMEWIYCFNVYYYISIFVYTYIWWQLRIDKPPTHTKRPTSSELPQINKSHIFDEKKKKKEKRKEKGGTIIHKYVGLKWPWLIGGGAHSWLGGTLMGGTLCELAAWQLPRLTFRDVSIFHKMRFFLS